MKTQLTTHFMQTNTILPRRKFVKTFALFSASVCLGGKALRSFFVTEVAAQSTTLLGTFRLSLDDFPDLQNVFGSVRLAVPGMPPSFVEIIVTRASGTTFYSVTSRCPHQGCTVEPYGVFSQYLECPCHGSRFGDTGNVVAGPAPRPLAWLEVGRAADGQLVIFAENEVTAGTRFQV